jgi:hypothetical protein
MLTEGLKETNLGRKKKLREAEKGNLGKTHFRGYS